MANKPKIDTEAFFKNMVNPEDKEKDIKSEEEQQNIVKQDENMKTIITPKEKEELRSKRVNFLMKPSVYAKVQKKCKLYNISVGECINQFLETWCEEK